MKSWGPNTLEQRKRIRTGLLHQATNLGILVRVHFGEWHQSNYDHIRDRITIFVPDLGEWHGSWPFCTNMVLCTIAHELGHAVETKSLRLSEVVARDEARTRAHRPPTNRDRVAAFINCVLHEEVRAWQHAEKLLVDQGFTDWNAFWEDARECVRTYEDLLDTIELEELTRRVLGGRARIYRLCKLPITKIQIGDSMTEAPDYAAIEAISHEVRDKGPAPLNPMPVLGTTPPDPATKDPRFGGPETKNPAK